MSATEIVRLHAIVEGRVQGVGFRAFVQDQGVAIGLSGWVRNRWDGTVEVLAEGSRPQVDKLLNALYRGPRSAYVSGVRVDWLAATGDLQGFRVRMTSND
jgi:acylphosphatase